MARELKQLKKSERAFIRRKKAEIRRKFYDAKKQKEMIDELYKNVLGGGGVVKVAAPVKAKKIDAKAKQKGKADVKAGAKMKNKVKVKK